MKTYRYGIISKKIKKVTYKLIPYLFFLLTIPKILSAQNIQVERFVNDSHIIFSTNGYTEYLKKVEQQSILVKSKMTYANTKAMYKTGSGFSRTFFEVVLSEKKEHIFKPHRIANFKIEYIIDETGEKVWSCALHFPKEAVFLSASEIHAVLTEAIQHKFDYVSQPKQASAFYFITTKAYDF